MKYVQCSCRKEWQLMETLTGRCRFCRKTSATHRKSVPADSWWSEQAREAEAPRDIVAWLQGVEMKWQGILQEDQRAFDAALRVIDNNKGITLSPLSSLIAQINWPEVRYCGYASKTHSTAQLWDINALSKNIGALAGYFENGLDDLPAEYPLGLFYDRSDRRMVQIQRVGLQITPWPAQPKK